MDRSLQRVDQETWVAWPAYVLIFLMLVFPMIHDLLYVKAALFAATVAIALLTMLWTGRSSLNLGIALWTISLSALATLFVLEGLCRGAQGAVKTAQVYVLWPIVYVIAITGVRNKRILSRIVGVAILSVSCIGLYSIIYLLIQTGILPENRYFDLISFDWQAQAFALHEGYVGMQFPGVDSLPFLLPFTMAALATDVPDVNGDLPFRRIWLWAATIFGLACVVLTGRRALFLVTMAGPLFTLLFHSFQPTKERLRNRKRLLRVTGWALALVVSLLFCLNAVYGIRPTGVIDRFSVGFDFHATSEDEGAIVRDTQSRALIAGWMENPLLGAGHGRPVYGSIRSELTPWSYEIYYLALLYQTGIVGVAAYGAGVVWIFWMGVRVMRSGGYLSAQVIPCLVGMSCILIANATNPYLARFDGMWAIFLPLGVINFWLVQHTKHESSALATCVSG